ncbi:MAG: hypothetical protein ACKO7P_09090 [Bacteroidota bacterium]
MKRQVKYFLLCLPILLVGCGPNDEELLKEAESKVVSFIDELNMQNFNSANEIYPDLNKISRYNIPRDFKISSSNFISENKNEVKIIGHYGTDKNSKPLQFVLSKIESGSWQINKTKGLSSYYESSLYNILKTSGCIQDIESDVSIHQTCLQMEPHFESMVSKYKNDIENSITFQNNGSNLSNNYNISISGDLMLKNNSNITIPGFSYDIYIVLNDRNGKLSHSVKYEFNSDPILANEYHQIRVFSMDYHPDYRKYSAVVKITNDYFIRSNLAQNGNINCSELLKY